MAQSSPPNRLLSDDMYIMRYEMMLNSVVQQLQKIAQMMRYLNFAYSSGPHIPLNAPTGSNGLNLKRTVDTVA